MTALRNASAVSVSFVGSAVPFTFTVGVPTPAAIACRTCAAYRRVRTQRLLAEDHDGMVDDLRLAVPGQGRSYGDGPLEGLAHDLPDYRCGPF